MRRRSHGTKGVILVVILIPFLGLLAGFSGMEEFGRFHKHLNWNLQPDQVQIKRAFESWGS